MTEKKKRGLLSWLGFGDDDQAKQPEQEQQVVEETQPEVVQEQEETVAEPEQENTL